MPVFKGFCWVYRPSTFILAKICDEFIRYVFVPPILYMGSVFALHKIELLFICWFVSYLLYFRSSPFFKDLILSSNIICWWALIITALRSSVLIWKSISISSKPFWIRGYAKSLSPKLLKKSWTSRDLSELEWHITFLLFYLFFEEPARCEPLFFAYRVS